MSDPRETVEKLLSIVEKIEQGLAQLDGRTVKKSTVHDDIPAKQPTVSKPDAATTEQFETVVDTVNNNMRDVQIMRRLTQGFQLVSQQANQFNPQAMSDITFQRTAKPANVAINPFKSQGGN